MPNSDDQEVLNIGDGEDHEMGTGDTGDTGDDNDRGDIYTGPPDDDGEGVAPGAGDELGDTGKGKVADGEVEGGTGKGSIPPHRLGEVSRERNAASELGQGFMDGTIERGLVEELGGYAAVVKAIANKELSLDDLKSVSVPGETRPAAAQPPPVADPVDNQTPLNDDPNHPSNWDLDSKFIEYQELVDAGETKDAAIMLRQLNKEERARERSQEVAAAAQVATMDHVKQLISDFPVLADKDSPEHESVMVWADHFQKANGLTRSAALDKAVVKVGLRSGSGNQGDNQTVTETPQQRTIRLRKEAALKKGAAASIAQPPPMGLGATPAGSTPAIDVAKLSEEDFSKLTEAERKVLRGDTL